MSHNRHTMSVRKQERAQLAHQQKELAAIARRLRRPDLGTEAPSPFNKNKQCRSARLERKRLHKPVRSSASGVHA